MKKIIYTLLVAILLVCAVSCSDDGVKLGKVVIDTTAIVEATPSDFYLEDGETFEIVRVSALIDTAKRYRMEKNGVELDVKQVCNGSATVYLPEGYYRFDNRDIEVEIRITNPETKKTKVATYDDLFKLTTAAPSRTMAASTEVKKGTPVQLYVVLEEQD